MSVGSDASSAPAICTLYGVTSEPATLLSATVTGHLAGSMMRKTAKRKSFQIDVNCQIAATTNAGIEIGSTTDQYVRSMPGAVHPRSLDQLVRDRRVVVAEDQRRDRDAVDDVREDESRDARRGSGCRSKQLRERDHHGLVRDEQPEEEDREDEVRARELPLREHEAVQRAEDDRDHRGRDHELEAVAETRATGRPRRLASRRESRRAAALHAWLGSVSAAPLKLVTSRT